MTGLMSEAAHRRGLIRKSRLQEEEVDPATLDAELVAELLLVISTEVVVGEFSLWDREVLARAAQLLTSPE